MARYFDKRVAEDARKTAAVLRDHLKEQGWRARGPVEADTPGSFVVEAETIDGLLVLIEVTGFPWENDGTWRRR